MKGYIGFFKMRFTYGLQYRSAAYAGIVTQFAWGFMYIMLYEALYKADPTAAPMEFDQLATYFWLQQAFLAFFMVWFLENDLFELITSGNVAYELCRPLDLYNMWFAKNCATRLSKAILRSFPILIVACLLPKPYQFTLPQSFTTCLLFIISMLLALTVVVSYCMFIYIFSFFTISPMGIKMIMVMLADFLAGGLIPLPFLPELLQKYIALTPFVAMQNMPFRIYNGHIAGKEAIISIMIQLFWAVVLVGVGKVSMKKAIKKVVVQGG